VDLRHSAGRLLTAAGVSVRPLSGPTWMLLMLGAALLFAYLRKTSGSLMLAIAAHSSFNLVMNLTIFGFLWTP
jgi:membrane protease YdiL (CAAX protease family)